MATYTDNATFTSQSELEATVARTGSWSGLGTFVVSGLLVEPLHRSAALHVAKYVGEANVPADIKRLRRSVHEVMRRMGSPVLVKHMFLPTDVDTGIARESPTFDDAYGQVRNRDPFSHGIGYVSAEKSTDEWISPNGAIVDSLTSPGADYIPAPKYRGYGPGYLTYIIEPDAATDFFKRSTTGALIQVQTATAQTGWFPNINDNDLIVNVTLNDVGEIADVHERYQTKTVNPVSIRGLDRKGRREYSGDNGNRHIVNQQFEMTLVPGNSTLQQVEVDR